MPLVEIDEKSLKERFAPEGSSLRRHQLRMLEILIEVDRICRKHSITYWLSSGTLLGAARHRGFIPWDDDLDIEMLDSDYKRLMRVLPEELPEHLALQSQATDPNYFYFYAKIRDRKSVLEENVPYDQYWRERGIYIDIFPLHRQPGVIHRLSVLAQGHCYKMVRKMQGDGTKMWKVRLWTGFNRRIFYPILRLMCRLLPGEVTYALGVPYGDPRRMNDILPVSEGCFEGYPFPIPRDMHKALTLKYGDYMRLPDLNKVQTHVSKLTFL